MGKGFQVVPFALQWIVFPNVSPVRARLPRVSSKFGDQSWPNPLSQNSMPRHRSQANSSTSSTAGCCPDTNPGVSAAVRRRRCHHALANRRRSRRQHARSPFCSKTLCRRTNYTNGWDTISDPVLPGRWSGAGQVSDHTGARALMNSLPAADWLLGDRGYGADWFREALVDMGITPSIRDGSHATRQSNMTSGAT